MIPVQDLAGPVQIMSFLVNAAEGQLQEGLHPGPLSGVLGEMGGEPLQAVNLFFNLGLIVFGDGGGFQLIPQGINLFLGIKVVTQFLLYHPHLLPQVVILLALFQLGLHLGGDFLLQLGQLNLPVQVTENQLDPIQDRYGFQDFLLLVKTDGQLARHHISRMARFGFMADQGHRFGGYPIGDGSIALEKINHKPQGSVKGGGRLRCTYQERPVTDLIVGAFCHIVLDLHPLKAINQDLEVIVRQLQYLADKHPGGHPVDLVRCGPIGLQCRLAGQDQFMATCHGLPQGPDRLLPTKVKGEQDTGIDDHAA